MVHYTPGDLRLLVILLLVVLHQLLRVFSGFAIDLLGVVYQVVSRALMIPGCIDLSATRFANDAGTTTAAPVRTSTR